MSQVRDIERRITDWFHSDATSVGSDRVLASALSRVASAPQERSAWMFTGMQAHGRIEASRSGRVALASGVIVVLVALFISFVPSPSRRDGSAASPPPRPSPTAETIALWPVQMPPGEYGAIVDRLPITFRVPDNGWFSGLDAGSLYFRDDPIHGWMRFWAPDQVYAHPCQHTLMGPIGPSAADLADAMASIPGISSSGVRDTVVGGLPAKHVRLTATQDMGCIPHDFYLWRDAGAEDSSIRRPRLEDSRIDVWIIDVNGRRLVIDTDAGRDADPETASWILAIVSSLSVEPVSKDVLAYVARVADVCADAGARMGSDRAIIGGFRTEPPEFTTLQAAGSHADAAARILEEALSTLRRIPTPGDIAATDIDPFGLVAATIADLDEIASAARAGDDTAVRSGLADAYVATNQNLAASGMPKVLSVVNASLAGCRLPSEGG